MEKESLTIVKVGLILATLTGLSYGVTLLVAPGLLVTMSGSEPVEPAWVRWAGGTLIAVCIGNILVFRNPKGQYIYVTMLALYNLLNAGGHLLTLIAQDFTGATWFVALPMVLTFAVSAVLWWGRQQAKGILKGD